jgi:hypothetical protein
LEESDSHGGLGDVEASGNGGEILEAFVAVEADDHDFGHEQATGEEVTERSALIERSPEGLPAQTIRVELDGWVFPRSGIALVWVLVGEVLAPLERTHLDERGVERASSGRR